MNVILDTATRRQTLRETLLDAAEKAVAGSGLPALKARDLAREAGCALGAIYNVFSDLDQIALAVNARTLGDLEAFLVERAQPGGEQPTADTAIAGMVRLASAYLDFAVANTQRWRAVFDHRMAGGKPVPDWYLAEQMRLFGFVEMPLAVLLPNESAHDRAALARSLVSAVHGMVALGLEEKLQALPVDQLRRQIALVVTTIGKGLLTRG
ncbi:TetR family transcriptional regulator [Variibacter gotjawalensis]|nr:TetR family transcriptional regulator [Variibacter gotjawalensis]